jgi:hypothetical protein
MLNRWRMIMLCGNIAVVVGVLTSWIMEGAIKPFTLALTAFNIAMMFTMYKPELKELIDKIKGNNDDDFRGGNFG